MTIQQQRNKIVIAAEGYRPDSFLAGFKACLDLMKTKDHDESKRKHNLTTAYLAAKEDLKQRK